LEPGDELGAQDVELWEGFLGAAFRSRDEALIPAEVP
jgi:hypothetical protein